MNCGFGGKIKTQSFQKLFSGGHLFVFVEYLCKRSPKIKTKNIKNYSSILAIVNHRNWLDDSPPLTKAFDTVQHKILLAKLNHYGIRGVVNNFFESYLINRSQAVIIHDNRSSKSNIDIGVPQGSSLGPLLFLLYSI